MGLPTAYGNGKPFTPTTARYRLDDLASSTEMIAWTDLTVGETMTILVPATANAIIDSARATEERVVTVQTDYGTSVQTSAEKIYRVYNLYFVPGP